MIHRIAKTVLGVLLLIAVATDGTANAHGFYLQAEFARNYVDETVDIDDIGVPIDDSLSAKRFAGGYQFGRFFAVEIAAVDLGDKSFSALGNRFSISGDGEEVAIIGYLPISKRFSLGAVAGMMWWEADVQAPGVRAELSENDAFFGLTAKFDANDRFGIVARAVNYRLDELDTLYASIGLRFSF